MSTLLDCSGSDRGQWSFHLFGIPIHVQMWFWISLVMLCGSEDTAAVLIWVGVCFVSILAHELGHVNAFKLFGEEAEVVLHAWGGLAIPRGCLRGPFPEFVVALAGPAAGFAVAGLTALAARYTGYTIHFGFHMYLPVISAWPAMAHGAHFQPPNYNWYLALNDLLFVNFYWGLINLLPVYPLDGSRAARAVFEQRDGYNGRRKALMLSAAVAVAVVLAGILERSIYIVIMFGLFAVSSLQNLEAERRRSRGPRPYVSWR